MDGVHGRLTDHLKRAGCLYDRTTRNTWQFDVSFSANKNLTIIQDVANPSYWPAIEVYGFVVLQRIESNSLGPSVVVNVFVNDPRINVSVNWDAGEQTLAIMVPSGIPWSEGYVRPCVRIEVAVWVPEEGNLNNLFIGTVQLGVLLLDNLSIEVSTAKFSSTTGKVVAASTGSETRDDSLIDVGAPDSFRFRSRFIEAQTASGNINGSWPLYNYLEMQSNSGYVKVNIEPKEQDIDAPGPAILYIHSISGNLEFCEPIRRAVSQALAHQAQGMADLRAETVLPPRDYRVNVHSVSGNIRGAAAFSSICSFKCTSGMMVLDVLPILDSSLAEKVTLQTSGTSGNTYLTVLDPLWVERGNYIDLAPAARALRNLHSDHSSTSADIRLRFPAIWRGDVTMSAMLGNLRARGEGLRVIQGSGWPELYARTIEGGGSKTTVYVVSGNVDFTLE